MAVLLIVGCRGKDFVSSCCNVRALLVESSESSHIIVKCRRRGAGGGDDSFFFSRSIFFGREIKYIQSIFRKILEIFCLFWIFRFSTTVLHVKYCRTLR